MSEKNIPKYSYSLNKNTITLNAPPPPKKDDGDRIGPEIGPDPRSSIGAKVSMGELPSQVGGNGILYDFAYGYRVKFPPNEKTISYTLKVYDLDSGVVLFEHNAKSGDFIIGKNKYYVRYRLEAYVGQELVFDADYDCENKTVYIIIPDGGLGDNLAWLPFADKFRMLRHADVTVVMGEWMIRLSGNFYPALKFIPLAKKPSLRGAYAIYFCGIFEKEKIAWRPSPHHYMGMQRSVAQILGLPLEDLKCRIPRGSARPVKEPYVCISTMATNPTKYWNYPDGWNILIRWLKSFGYRVFDIDRDKGLSFTPKHKYRTPSEAEDLTGLIPISERIHYLEHADFFVGLPSGLSWLAWNCDIPVVMISGFTMPNCEFPTSYRVTNYLFCHGCWNDTNNFFDPKAPVWCPYHVGTEREIECTKVISPKMVQETIMRIPQFQKHIQSLKESGMAKQQNSSVVSVLPSFMECDEKKN